MFRQKALFSDEFEAWIHGPAIPSIYREYRSYRWEPIFSTGSVSEVDSSEANIIRVVLDTYGDLSGKYLEELTHCEQPWLKARTGLHWQEKSRNRISRRDMSTYYRQFVQSYRPPRIVREATEVMAIRSKHTLKENVMRGASSVLQIFPSNVSRDNTRSLRKRFGGPSNDADAIASDWNRVGSYIWSAHMCIDSEDSEDNE